jgi:lysozyme family protein
MTFIKKWEGGFSNHPNDNGGATMQGITLATYNSWRAKHGKSAATAEQLKQITDAEWEAVFTENYWMPCKADQIKNKLNACVLVSWAWGSGVTGAVKSFQKAAGISVDGVVGNATINALNSFSFSKLIEVRRAYFNSIVANNSSQSVFLQGWLNRLADFQKTFAPFA